MHLIWCHIQLQKLWYLCKTSVAKMMRFGFRRKKQSQKWEEGPVTEEESYINK